MLKMFFIGAISCIITSGWWKVFTTDNLDDLHWHWKVFGKLYIAITLVYIVVMVGFLILGIHDFVANYHICKN
jgi:type III secretory pathway component EscU